LRLPVGVKMGRIFAGKRGFAWTPELRAVYTAELADDSTRVQTRFAGVQDNLPFFYAESGRWGRHSGRFGAGIGSMAFGHLTARADYDYEIHNHLNIHIFSATLGVQW